MQIRISFLLKLRHTQFACNVFTLKYFPFSSHVHCTYVITHQAQSFMTALKASQGLSKVTDHIKNYRPKILVLSGTPSNRQNLVDFGNLISKKISLMSTLDIVDENSLSWRSLDKLKQDAQKWLLDNKIKAFHVITRRNSFSEGVRAALELQGLGKLSPNMVLVGFKENWREDSEGSLEYYRALHTAMDMRLAVGILRLPTSYHQAEELTVNSAVQRCDLFI